jgi:hypothetical protein
MCPGGVFNQYIALERLIDYSVDFRHAPQLKIQPLKNSFPQSPFDSEAELVRYSYCKLK